MSHPPVAKQPFPRATAACPVRKLMLDLLQQQEHGEHQSEFEEPHPAFALHGLTLL
jgi:hypothetical protein